MIEVALQFTVKKSSMSRKTRMQWPIYVDVDWLAYEDIIQKDMATWQDRYSDVDDNQDP